MACLAPCSGKLAPGFFRKVPAFAAGFLLVANLVVASASEAADRPTTRPGTNPPDSTALLHFLASAHGGQGGNEIELTLTVRRSDRVSQRRYRVLDSGAGETIVEFLDPLERGRKILATAGELWFLSPRTHRAVRIPPAQRVFGDASYGDVARPR